ncbi:seminal metalloprotease 1-like isoform X2 [Galleria mellonella]|nr:seminal metalloprotease 1-like isoform X2 [Galleria mellonella]
MGNIPYYFDTKSYDYLIGYRVRAAMDILEEASCVRFKPLTVKPTNASSWIHITNPEKKRECIHEPRYQDKGSGAVIWVLGFDCLQRRELLHSLMHAIGFKDEVSHSQRDQYVRVMWENIHPKYRPLFRIQNNEASSKYSVEYDPLSIMHFHDRAYSNNGHPTITPLVSGLIISPSDELSQLDKMKLRIIFGHECNRRKVGDLLDSCKDALHDHTFNKENDNKNHNGTYYLKKEEETIEIKSNMSQEINEEKPNEIKNDLVAEYDNVEVSDSEDKKVNDNESEAGIESSKNY